MTPSEVEGLLREFAPKALGAVARRCGEFAGAEDGLDVGVAAGGAHGADLVVEALPVALQHQPALRGMASGEQHPREDGGTSWLYIHHSLDGRERLEL